MRDTELKQMRNTALYAAYKKGLENSSFASMREAGKVVCRMSAPRYYISAEVASDLVGMIIRKVSLINLNSCNRRQAWQLYDDYVAFLEENPGCRLSRERIMEELVERPAPEFYIEAQRARKILDKENNKRRKQWGSH